MAILQGCRSADVEPLLPHKFEVVITIKLPEIQRSSPEPIAVTFSAQTTAARSASLNAGISSLPTSGDLPSVLTQAAASMNGALAITNISSTEYISKFTPDVLTNLSLKGVLPPALQTKFNELVKTPDLQAYLSGFSPATVNGQEINASSTTVTYPRSIPEITEPVSITSIINALPSKAVSPASNELLQTANKLLTSKAQEFEKSRAEQISRIDSAYDQEKIKIAKEFQDELNRISAKYTALMDGTNQNFTANTNALKAAKSRLNDQYYNLLTALLYTLYSNHQQANHILHAIDNNALVITMEFKNLSATITRNTDIKSVNASFNETLKSTQDLILKLYQSSNDTQGSGQ
ncbi:hypothetical protein [Spirosoma fluminis]